MNQLSGGYNGFPRGVVDDVRLYERDIKLKIIVHAEANAIAAAARNGYSVKGATAFITHPPCVQCASLLIQAGITKVVYTEGTKPSKWEQEWLMAVSMLREAGVMVAEVEDINTPPVGSR
jgi:dCMP deaminase